ncbi:hypothetical protein CBS101457_006019 [Exobasidium rhododendri]|nr:hypothetical protein CBS101457_006019 [Exobasidium rhododendri]
MLSRAQTLFPGQLITSGFRVFATQSSKVEVTPGSVPPPKPSILSKTAPFAALARLDKPTGTLLLFLPCSWSLTLAAHSLHLPPGTLAWNTLLFGTGAFIMRGAGCTINDLWDRDLDAQVERTKQRPLAAGVVTPFQAISFLGLQLSAGLAILLQLNWNSITLGASSLSLVVLYPLMKRITYWPQLVLGLAFNWGALLGWCAMAGTLQNGAPILIPLYCSSICWTLVYDTIYAHQDTSDDVTAGIKSTALLFGQQSKLIMTGFSTAMVSLFALAVRNLDRHSAKLLNLEAANMVEFLSTGHPFFCASMTLAALHLAWQIKTVDLNSRADCWSKFRSNVVLGSILWAGLLLDYYFQVVLSSEENPSATHIV